MDRRRLVQRLLTFGIAPVWLAACGREDPSEQGSSAAPPRIEVVEATPRPMETIRTWPATMQPLRIHEIVAPHDGRVTIVHVAAGSAVEAGASIAEMALPEAEARLDELSGQVEQLQTILDGRERAASVRAASEADVANARARYHEAAAELRALEATIAEAVVTAPTGGVVLELPASAGSYLVAETVLARIADATSVGLRLDVANSELRYFDTPETLRIMDDRGSEHRVANLVALGEVSPRTTRLELWLAPETSPATGAATVEYRSSREALCIPWTAVAADDGRSWVALVDVDGIVSHRDITTGGTTGTLVEVVSGLESGDRIALYQPRSLRQGAQVTPAAKADAPSDSE